MNIIRKSESVVFKPNDCCEVAEYEFNDKDINIGTAIINGRFPETGYLVNEKVKEYAYVVRGIGKLATRLSAIDFGEGDVVFIPAGEAYYWEGDFQLVMPCSPAWYPEQSKLVE